jgi:hypothetical protein
MKTTFCKLHEPTDKLELLELGQPLIISKYNLIIVVFSKRDFQARHCLNIPWSITDKLELFFV